MGNELHTMPLKCERLLSSQNYRMMTWDERGAYLQLLVEAWLEQCFLPAQPMLLRRLLGVDDDAVWDRIKKNVVDTMFELTDDGGYIYNPTQLTIFQETQSKHRKRVEAGRQGGKQGPSDAQPTLDQSPTIQSQSQSQNNTPPDSPPKKGGTRKLTQAQKKRKRVQENTELMIRIGSWFRKKPSTKWTIAEWEALQDVNPSEEEIEGMERYYTAEIPEDQDQRRHSLLTLLNNWQGELDKARRHYRIVKDGGHGCKGKRDGSKLAPGQKHQENGESPI